MNATRGLNISSSSSSSQSRTIVTLLFSGGPVFRPYLNRRSAIAALSCCLATPAIYAQTITGSVTGVVTDSSGAEVPHATVVAKNLATGIETTATTNASGEYDIRFLQIGQYVVTISNAGFRSFQTQPFTLEVNQTAKVDGALSVGQANESVEVSDQLQPILDTENATVTTTFTANTIENLPLNGRNFSSITMFLPGAVATDPAGMSGANGIERDTNQSGQVSVNGNRNQTNNYLLDGIEINETINNVIGYNPSPDAIENLTVITSNAGAEYGNVNGGDVVAVLKSGTNHLHGSAFAFLENHNLDANDWANNFSGVAKPNYTQTIFGGTLGGPILKDKLFFFADYEGARYHLGGTDTASVLPQAYRNGDFSRLLAGSHPLQLTHFVPGVGRVPYANNQVPITNPVAQYLFAHPEYYPLPNKADSGAYGQDNYIGASKITRRNDQADVKIDFKLSSRDTMNVRYSQGEASDATPNVPLAITFPGTNSYPFKGIAINEVHTFCPSIINEFRAGWSRVRWVQGVPQDSTGNFASGNSLVGINYAQPYQGFTDQDFSASQGGTGNETYFSSVGTAGGGSSLINNIFTYGDNVTFLLHKHTVRTGVEILRYQQNNFYPGNQGVMGLEQYAGAFTGDTAADFLTNQVYFAGVSANTGRTGQRQYRDAGFIQDDWKPTQNLTVNLGVRYEYDQPVYEVNDKQANLDLATGGYYYAGTPAAAAAFGDGHALYKPVYTNVMPRIGFAYNPTPRFVLRGGYGITNYLEGTGANLRLNFNPPFQPSYQYQAVAASDTGAGTPLTAQNALPADFTTSSSSNTLRAWDKNLRPAFIQEFTLSTEYQLNNKTSVVVGYVGQTGQHLVDARAGNQLTAPGTAAPYAAQVGQDGAVVVTESESMMNYNAGQVTMRHRQSNGLEFQVNYTFAKALTNNPGFFGTANVNGASAYWQNGYNGHADYGPSGFDTRHNASATFVYQLPFGRGQKFGGGMNRLVDQAVGGWKITGAAIAYSGLPVTISGPNSTSVNNRASRANHYRKLQVADRSVARWFGNGPSSAGCAPGVDNGVCAYGQSGLEQFGTASVGTERAPGYNSIDLSGGKAFRFTEAHALEFRADLFNAFNLASYGNPDNNITDTNFGQITNTRSLARQIQFSLHYSF